MSIKYYIKNSSITKPLYHWFKNFKKEIIRASRTSFHGKFINRQKGLEKLCIVLAGYKEYLYPAVFGRIKAYMEDDIDVCIITSGKWSDTVDEICKEQNWSYLSTKENDVSLVQNVAINLHKNAKYIYKLDEDIFVTKGYFKNMFNAYLRACESRYNPGVIAPLLNINGFTYLIVLEKLGLVGEYESRFGKAKYSTTENDIIQNSPEVARFFWGEGGVVPDIDTMNAIFSKGETKEIACSIRFSIGAILFERSLWESMDYFRMVRGTNSLGVDEADICRYCCLISKPLMVSENVVVGHLSFGPQNATMKQYYLENKSMFDYVDSD